MALKSYDLIHGEIDKVQTAIDRLRAFEPPEGYYVAFSGGKDSQCIYHLCEMAGVKFDAHYRVTSVDPPELVQFIKRQYPTVSMEIPHDKDGKPITMWNLIPHKGVPTRLTRFCCEKLKESGGIGRLTVTGVRWAESSNRKAGQSLITMPSPKKSAARAAEENGAEIIRTRRGGLTLNMDNSASRRTVEQCYRTNKTLLNPIIDWEDEDVWEYLNDVAKVPHCELYDRGYTRLGCIGCPMSSHAASELAAYPKYRGHYIRAFDKMLVERERKGKPTQWKTGEEVMEWWLGGSNKREPELEGQINLFVEDDE